MFKNIIFDWSGVVKNAADSHIWVVKKMFEKLGNSITPEEIKDNWEEPYMKFWEKYYLDMTLEEEKKVYCDVMTSKDCPPPKPYPGIIELIKKLKKSGMKMAVLSSDWPVTFNPEIKKFGLENFFNEVAIGAHNKSEVIEDLIKRNNFKKDETAFIGDTSNEIEAGKQAGIKTVAVTWGLCSEKILKELGPDYLVHDVKKLEEILLK